MDADALSLLIILRQELKEIANTLQPQTEVIEDIITDNGIIDDDNDDNDSRDEDEKAQELHSNTKHKMNYNEIGDKVDELISNYLTPTIKQLNKKKRKNRKKSIIHNSNNSNNYQLSPSLTPHHHHHNNHNNDNHEYDEHELLLPHNSNNSYLSPISEPGQVIDNMTNYSEKLGKCCRKFITSLFCGCGMFQTIGIIVVLLTFGTIFVFYRATELTLILKELNHWKELSVKRIEYELMNEQKLAQINFDLDVDIDKLKVEHQHRQNMEIIEAKTLLTKEFIDKNTRTVTTTYWNFLTTETETVSQTIFSEEDIAFFQNNILYYGFNSDKAIESPQKNKDKTQQIDNNNDNDNDNDNETNTKHHFNSDGDKPTTCKSSSSDDSFDSI